MQRKIQKRFGIYWLPNSLTIMSLICGLYAIILSFKGDFKTACLLLVVASILDVLDGFVAKLTKSTSDFGAQLDSLCDMVSFGATPAIIAWLWINPTLGNNATLAVFIFAAMSAMRLARFNTQLSDKESKPYFQGLPTPAGSALVISLIWVGETFAWQNTVTHWGVFISCILAGILMVSNVRYPGIKHLGKRRVPFIGLLALVLIFMVILSQPQLVIWIISLGYVLFGISYTLVLRRQRRIQRKLKNTIDRRSA